MRPAMKFLDGSNVHYYWDATGINMRRFGRALGMDLDLWDFWAIYLPSTQWTGETPPAPEFWQHQLTGLPEEKRLVVSEFVTRIKDLRDGPQT